MHSGIDWFDHGKKVTCVVTVTRVGSWCSMGSEAVDFPTSPTFSQDSGSLYTQEGEILDRYRQGIKIIFRQHGTIGVFSFFRVVDSLVQAIVLFSLVTRICTILASEGIPDCIWQSFPTSCRAPSGYFERLRHFASVFKRYQSTPVDAEYATVRTAANAASRASVFFKTYDPALSGRSDHDLSPRSDPHPNSMFLLC